MSNIFKVEVDKLIAPTAKKLWAVSSPSAIAIRNWLEQTLVRIPVTMNAVLTKLYGVESRFRGAIWEVFWWDQLDKFSKDITVESRTNLASKKSVDFIATFPTGKKIALEVSTINEDYEDINREFVLDNLHKELKSSLYGPYKYIHMIPIQFDAAFSDFTSVINAVRDWLNDVAYNRIVNPLNEPTMRLNSSAQGVLLDFQAMAFDPFSATKVSLIRSPAPSKKVDEKERLRARIIDKAKKFESVPDLPLVIAVSEASGFMTGTFHSRATALVGDLKIAILENGTSAAFHDNNGIFLGPDGWLNTEVSALILNSASVPSPDFEDFEIWIHGGAQFPLEPEDLGFTAKYFRINENCVEEFQGTGAVERWVAVTIP